MTHKILTKRIEPYDLLETLKKQCIMKDYTFDGHTKNDAKNKFLKELHSAGTFGLYMKNVNKFYIFKGNINIEKTLKLTSGDYINSNNFEEVINAVDLGKAEAGFIIL